MPASVPDASCTSKCNNTSNNKFPKCPPRMDDGRHFTNYQPNCYVNNLLQENNGLHNSFQTRMFLTHNATQMMELNRKEACSKNCCGPCQPPYDLGTMMPEASAQVVGGPVPCGPKSSSAPLVGAHSNAPLTCAAWSVGDNRDLDYNCCSPVSNLANQYPHSHDDVVITRKAVQGGGMPAVGR